MRRVANWLERQPALELFFFWFLVAAICTAADMLARPSSTAVYVWAGVVGVTAFLFGGTRYFR